jgi:hypothetical protein
MKNGASAAVATRAWQTGVRRMSNALHRKLTTAYGLFANPDRMRIFLKAKFPSLSDDSIAVHVWYPAFWRLVSYNLCRYLGMKRKVANRNGPKRYVTRIPNSAGIGDQVSSCWVETYSIAKKLHLHFVHQAFMPDIHSPDVDWESFLGFGIGEIQETDLALYEGPQAIKTVFVPPFRHDTERGLRTFEKIITEVYNDEFVLFHLGTGVYLNNGSEREFSPYDVLRSRYFRANSNLPLNRVLGSSYEIQIAVHVRRGDLKSFKLANPGEYNKRWLNIEYYQEILSSILAELGKSPYSIHVVSDGTADDLRALTAEFSCILHLGQSAELAFHQMVLADILVPGLSSFSLVAGKISRGVKVVGSQFDEVKPSLLLPQTSDWIRLKENGLVSFQERRQLRRSIRSHCSSSIAFARL